MRTRSEWFLGGRGGSLELSNCDNYHGYFGGSTNDIQEHPALSNNEMLLMLQQHHQHNRQHHQQQQQQQQHQEHHLQQRMETDIPTDEHNITSITPASAMMLMDTNFAPISVGNIGLSASAESVHYPVKRSSRRGPNIARHHPHRSSSRRNKENGKNSTGTSASVNNNSNTLPVVGTSTSGSGNLTSAVGGIVGDGGICIGGDQAHRSSSFRQKKSNNLITDCSTSKHRKPRAVSFDQPATQQQQQQQLHQKVSLTAIVKGSSNVQSLEENTIFLMDTTPPPPSISLSASVHDLQQQQQSARHLHFKPPRV